MTEYERESSSSTKKVVHRDQKPGGALAEFVVSSSEFLPFEIEEPKKKKKVIYWPEQTYANRSNQWNH